MAYVLVFNYTQGWSSRDNPFYGINKCPIMGVYLDKTKALVDCINTNLIEEPYTFDEYYVSKSGKSYSSDNLIQYGTFDLESLNLIYTEVIDILQNQSNDKYTSRYCYIKDYNFDELVQQKSDEENEDEN